MIKGRRSGVSTSYTVRPTNYIKQYFINRRPANDSNRHTDSEVIIIILVDTILCFFFQAEDGIRDYKVTGVQTCALPIFARLVLALDLLVVPVDLRERERDLLLGLHPHHHVDLLRIDGRELDGPAQSIDEIGRASCRERV